MRKPHQGLLASLLMQSSPVRLLMCAIICFVMGFPCLWLYAAMAESVVILWGEGSVIAVIPRHEIPVDQRFGDGPNATIKRTLALAGSITAFICLFASLALRVWAAARLIADALAGRGGAADLKESPTSAISPSS